MAWPSISRTQSVSMSNGCTCVVGAISRSWRRKKRATRATSRDRAPATQSKSAWVRASPASVFHKIVSLSSAFCAAGRRLKRARKRSARRMWKMRVASWKLGVAFTNVAPACSSSPTSSLMPLRIAGATGRPPKSSVTAMVRSRRFAGSTLRNVSPGSGRALVTVSSGPAMADSSSAKSSTFRAIGPAVEMSDHAAFSFAPNGTRPGEGRKPTTLQNAAGLRSEPPVSLPSAMGMKRAARAAAAPPLLPPHVRAGS